MNAIAYYIDDHLRNYSYKDRGLCSFFAIIYVALTINLKGEKEKWISLRLLGVYEEENIGHAIMHHSFRRLWQ